MNGRSSAPTVRIAGVPIGVDHPPYVVAELSANHNGSLDRALAIVRQAKEAGAHAVKLQTYTPDTMTLDHDGPGFRIESGLWAGQTLYELYRQAQTPWEWHPVLFEEGGRLGITVFSSPFDESAVDLLEELGAPAYKIASFEALDLPLIARAARTGKPVIISTGMASLGEIADAVAAARANGAQELVLLHCVSAYPAPVADCNLATIPHLASAFDVVVGLSDHTLGTAVSVAAVSLGACLIEKHLTLARSDGGVDASFSLEPDELADLVRATRDSRVAVGRVSYEREASERASLVFRRSLYVVRDIAAGEALTHENVRAIRPGFGLAPKHLEQIVGLRARRTLARGTPLAWDLVE
jgi:N-acetylneuraminate synthase